MLYSAVSSFIGGIALCKTTYISYSVFRSFHWLYYRFVQSLSCYHHRFLSTALLAAATLAPLARYYQEDERWMDLQPSLGWCFWLATVSACLSCLLCGVVWKYAELKRASSGSTAPSSTPSSQPPAAERATATVSPLSVAYTGRKVSVVRESLHNPQGRDGGATGGGVEFPVLRLPRYDEHPEPGTSLPCSPPPSYEEAIRGSYTPPPYPHVPDTTSSARSSHR